MHACVQVFLPLNRQALLVVLTECKFEVSEYKVVRAVKNWTKNSIWVKNSYSSAPMPIDQVHVIMQHTDPFCLTIEEFDEFSSPPSDGIFNHWTYQKVRGTGMHATLSHNSPVALSVNPTSAVSGCTLPRCGAICCMLLWHRAAQKLRGTLYFGQWLHYTFPSWQTAIVSKCKATARSVM